MNRDELFTQHVPVATGIAHYYYLAGADHDDVRQEALIALWVASRDYNPDTGVPFEVFARIVLRRRLATSVNSARALKHDMLTSADRQVILDNGVIAEAVSLAVDKHGDAFDQAARRQHVRDVVAAVNRDLSPLERETLLRVMNGGMVGDKSADNALHRARTKLRALEAA